jgi:hypothetical protein
VLWADPVVPCYSFCFVRWGLGRSHSPERGEHVSYAKRRDGRSPLARPLSSLLSIQDCFFGSGRVHLSNGRCGGAKKLRAGAAISEISKNGVEGSELKRDPFLAHEQLDMVVIFGNVPATTRTTLDNVKTAVHM